MRLILSGRLHPWLNMALDQVLEPEPPVLRLYGWDPPGLSLGYFQRASDFPSDTLDRDGLVLVRRVTGGRAICHKDDLTFSIVSRPDVPLFRGPVEQSYLRIHRAIARGLQRLGVDTSARASALAKSDSGRHGEPVCFYQATSFDLVADGRKLVGSAQRRTRDRVLHHGSIPIVRNPLAPEAACLEELLGRTPTLDEVAEAVVEGFVQDTGLHMKRGEPRPAEWEHARRLVEEQFGTESWNRRR